MLVTRWNDAYAKFIFFTSIIKMNVYTEICFIY